MAGYKFQRDESFIHRSEGVGHGLRSTYFNHELILTDKNLVLIKKNIWGKRKNELVFPLTQVKDFQGRPQVFVSDRAGRKTLDVHFMDSSEHFAFAHKREAVLWEKNLHEVLTGFPSDISSTPDSALHLGAEKAADALKQTVDAFKNAFGMKTESTITQATAAAGKVAGDCVSCGAPLAGYRGRRIVCDYCDTTNLL